MVSPEKIPRSAKRSPDRDPHGQKQVRILKVALLYCYMMLYVYIIYTLYIMKIYMEDLDHNSISLRHTVLYALYRIKYNKN